MLSIVLLRSTAAAQDQPAESAENGLPHSKIPFDQEPYKIRVLISFSNDARLTTRLRQNVLRRFRSHASAFVGDAWDLEHLDVSRSLALSSAASIAALTAERVEPFTSNQDKLFVLGVRVDGDRTVLAAREYDVFFQRWGPVFQGSARESTQIARELIVLSSRMFSPLARLETGDATRVTALIKGGSLPTLNPAAVDARSKYKPSFDFLPHGALLRPMRPVFNEDRTEIIAMTPMGWTFYVVEGRQGPLASCRVDSALSHALPPRSDEPDEPQLIVARTASGTTQLRLVDNENYAPLAAMDVEKLERRDQAAIPLGTTDSDGRIEIPPNRSTSGLVWVIVRHGRDAMTRPLPILPGAGEEPDLALRPDPVRLDIEGRIMAMQTYIVDQVARRTILAGRLNPTTLVHEGGLIRKSIEKKDWKQAEDYLAQLKDSPRAEAMNAKLEAAREYARTQRPEEKWTGKIKRLFAETEDIINLYFNMDEQADRIEELEDELKSQMEEAAANEALPAGQPAAGSATGGSAQSTPDRA